MQMEIKSRLHNVLIQCIPGNHWINVKGKKDGVNLVSMFVGTNQSGEVMTNPMAVCDECFVKLGLTDQPSEADKIIIPQVGRGLKDGRGILPSAQAT
jgi:hypothetical protein